MKSSAGAKFEKNFEKDYDVYYLKPLHLPYPLFEAYRGTNLMTSKQHLVERIPKQKINEKKLAEGIEKLKSAHPNIVEVCGWYSNEHYIYIIYEGCLANPMQDYLSDGKIVSEKQAVTIARQLLRGLNYSCSGIYTGFDFSKIFFISSGFANFDLKIVNQESLDLVRSCLKEKPKAEFSPRFEAPETLEGKASPLSVMWTLGTMLYKLLIGRFPFDEVSKEPKDKILKGKSKLVHAFFENKPECNDFITRLLKPEKQRMTAEEALSHPWLQGQKEEAKSRNAEAAVANLSKGLAKFSDTDVLKRIVLSYLVSTFDNRELAVVTNAFQEMDANGDGKLSKEEMKKNLKVLSEDEKMLKFLEMVDTDKSGYVDYREFCVAAIGHKLMSNKEKLKKVFAYLDKRKNGSINQKELVELLEPHSAFLKKGELKKMVAGTDINKDGKISLKELLNFIGTDSK